MEIISSGAGATWQARAADRMARMRQGEDLDAEEWTITRKDGGRRTLFISTKVVLDARGVPRVLGVMHDVTDRVRLEQQLRVGFHHAPFRRRVDGVTPARAHHRQDGQSRAPPHEPESAPGVPPKCGFSAAQRSSLPSPPC